MSDLPAEPDTIVEQGDPAFLEDFPDLVGAIDTNLEEFLFSHPAGFERLVTRVAELDDAESAVSEHPEAFDQFVSLVWQTLELVTEAVPSAGEAVTEDLVVEWDCVDTDLRFHIETDPESGIVTGAATPGDEPDLVFIGDTDTLLRMIGDREFDGQQAFMQGEFQIEGPLPIAIELDEMMGDVIAAIEDLTAQ